jgi:hypothetical protein
MDFPCTTSSVVLQPLFFVLLVIPKFSFSDSSQQAIRDEGQADRIPGLKKNAACWSKQID